MSFIAAPTSSGVTSTDPSVDGGSHTLRTDPRPSDIAVAYAQGIQIMFVGDSGPSSSTPGIGNDVTIANELHGGLLCPLNEHHVRHPSAVGVRRRARHEEQSRGQSSEPQPGAGHERYPIERKAPHVAVHHEPKLHDVLLAAVLDGFASRIWERLPGRDTRSRLRPWRSKRVSRLHLCGNEPPSRLSRSDPLRHKHLGWAEGSPRRCGTRVNRATRLHRCCHPEGPRYAHPSMHAPSPLDPIRTQSTPSAKY